MVTIQFFATAAMLVLPTVVTLILGQVLLEEGIGFSARFLWASVFVLTAALLFATAMPTSEMPTLAVSMLTTLRAVFVMLQLAILLIYACVTLGQPDPVASDEVE